jgi:cell division protein FtsL
MSSLASQELAGGAMTYRRERQLEQTARPAARRSPARLVLFFVALFAVSLFYVWSHAQVVRVTYTLSKLQNQEKELATQNEKLGLEIALLRSPTTLARAAATLQMVPPDPNQIVMVK